MLKQIALATFTATALVAATLSTANAGGGAGCPTWGCGENGTQLTGLALGNASTGSVSVVILPTGEVLDLR